MKLEEKGSLSGIHPRSNWAQLFIKSGPDLTKITQLEKPRSICSLGD